MQQESESAWSRPDHILPRRTWTMDWPDRDVTMDSPIRAKKLELFDWGRNLGSLRLCQDYKLSIQSLDSRSPSQSWDLESRPRMGSRIVWLGLRLQTAGLDRDLNSQMGSRTRDYMDRTKTLDYPHRANIRFYLDMARIQNY